MWGNDNHSIPARREGDVLTEIRFHNEMDEASQPTDRVVGQFRHRDGRIWSARIVPLPADKDRPIFPQEAFLMALSSGGCRQYNFISRRLQNAKSTALRFSNMPMEPYQRLIADAQGTSEYPRSGEIAVYRIHVIRREYRGRGRSELTRYDVDGVGRYEGDKLVIFPNSHEIEEILDSVCGDNTRVLVPEGINMLPRQATLERIDLSMARQHLDERVIDMDHIAGVVGHHFNDSADQALAGLSDGSYRVREERMIDFREDERTDDG